MRRAVSNAGRKAPCARSVDTCARSTDQARSLSVSRSQAGPVALSIRRARYSFFAAGRRRPGEPVLLTGPADDRSGSLRQTAGRLVDLSGEPAGIEAGERCRTPAMSLGVPRRPAGQPDELLRPIGRVGLGPSPLSGVLTGGSDGDRCGLPLLWGRRRFIDLPSISLGNEDLGAGETADGPVGGCVRAGWHPHHTEPGF